jgi:hypothetical protein
MGEKTSKDLRRIETQISTKQIKQRDEHGELPRSSMNAASAFRTRQSRKTKPWKSMTTS